MVEDRKLPLRTASAGGALICKAAVRDGLGDQRLAGLRQELAVLLIDARKGLLPQTCRHSIICHLLGIRHVLLAVNKMDLVDFDRTVFERISTAYAAFAARLNFTTLVPIPLSARFGDNLMARGSRMNWYCGPTLLEQLETVEVDSGLEQKPFRMPVQ